MEMRLKIFENTFQIAAQAHGRPDGLRVLAYPGWLDNAGSFKFLGAELAKLGCFVVAVDPPGCGFSDHVPRCSFYNDFDEVATLLEIAEALGWSEPFIVMAHSRGGGIALAAAGALPHRFKGVILLDSFATLTTGGIGYEDVQPTAPSLMRAAFETDQKNRKREPRVFASFEEAVQSSMTHPWFPKLRASAVAIVERHVLPVADDPNKFTFIHDVRTYGQRQMVHATLDMMLEFARDVTCPVLSVVAERPSELRERLKESIDERMRAVRDLTYRSVKGNHHVHLDDAPAVAAAIRDWLSAKFVRDAGAVKRAKL